MVGNKADVEELREVSYEKGEQLKNELKLDYFIEISSKSNEDTKKIFSQCAKLLYNDIFNNNNNDLTASVMENIMVKKSDDKRNKGKKCSC